MTKQLKIWCASDLHLGHKNLTEPAGESVYSNWSARKKGYEEEFFIAWSACVGNDDVVILCGDIAFSQQALWFGRISSMPGNKVLLLGNHDRNRINWYKKWGFIEVVPFGESRVHDHALGNVMFSHIPADPAVALSYDDRFQGLAKKHAKEFKDNSCILNVHGHTHGQAKERQNTFDCTLDVIGNQLLTLDQIIEHKLKK